MNLMQKTIFQTGLFLMIVTGTVQATEDPLKSAIDSGLEAQEDAITAQQHVDSLANETVDLLQEYRNALYRTDDLKEYVDQLEKQVKAQEETLVSLKKQSANAEVTQREFVPFMLRMVDALEKFVALDMPFLSVERKMRVKTIKEMMDRPDVSLPEKYRRIMEAYQIEMGYGRTIETGSDTISLNGKNTTVDVLQIGRVALLYQTLDGKECGYWNKKGKIWDKLPDDYNESVKKGILIARKQSSPDFFNIPVAAPEKSR